MNQQPILIRNGHLLSMDERLGEMPCADILIERAGAVFNSPSGEKHDTH